MGGGVSLLIGIFSAVRALLEKLAQLRRARLRERAASDGSGLLLDKLNPGADTDASGAEKPAASDAERSVGRVDE